MHKTYLIIASLILLGIFLLVAYSKIAEEIVNVPSTSSVKRANQGIFTLGITFIVSGISFGICHHKCGMELDGNSNTVLGFLMLLGIVMTTLSAMIVGKVSGSGKSWATTTLVIGILFVVSVGGAFAYIYKEKLGMKFGENYHTMKFGENYDNTDLSQRLQDQADERWTR